MLIKKRLRDVIFLTLFENVSSLIFSKYALICFLTFNNNKSIKMSIKIRKF